MKGNRQQCKEEYLETGVMNNWGYEGKLSLPGVMLLVKIKTKTTFSSFKVKPGISPCPVSSPS